MILDVLLEELTPMDVRCHYWPLTAKLHWILASPCEVCEQEPLSTNYDKLLET